MPFFGAALVVLSPFGVAHAQGENTSIAETAVVDICRRAHREGYDRVYAYLSSTNGQNLRLAWWPDSELTLSESDLAQLNRDIIQFKNPINATVAELVAPRSRLRKTELKFKEQYPRLSHFIVSQAVKAHFARSMQQRALDRALQSNRRNHDDGLLDAKRHAVWAALLGRYLGPRVAFCVLGLHEVENSWRPEDGIFKLYAPRQVSNKIMDFYNNAVGVRLGTTFVGTDDEMIQHVDKLLLDGDVVVLNFDHELTRSSWWFETATQRRAEKYEKRPIHTFLREIL